MTDFDAAQLPALCDTAIRDLAEVKTIGECLNIRNLMEAARVYAAEHKMPNEAQAIVIRAVILAERRIGQELIAIDEARARKLATWRAEAARYANERDCEVCGQWFGLTHGHHVYPLAWQADDGRDYADHTMAWLCPNHHAAVHLFLSDPVAVRRLVKTIKCPKEASLIARIGARGLALAGRLPC